jgi:hypothetical protein
MNLPLLCWWDLWIFDTILPWFFMCTTTGAAVWAWFRSRLPWWLGGTPVGGWLHYATGYLCAEFAKPPDQGTTVQVTYAVEAL